MDPGTEFYGEDRRPLLSYDPSTDRWEYLDEAPALGYAGTALIAYGLVLRPDRSDPIAFEVPSGHELSGVVDSIDLEPPPTLDCFPSTTPDPRSVCPLPGVEVVGSVTIDGTVVIVTEDTFVETCGPTDGAVPIEFDDAPDLLGQVDGLTARAKIVVPSAGSRPPWTRATSLFLGSCG